MRSTRWLISHYFNPPAHTGRDDGHALYSPNLANISIHPPTRGGTEYAKYSITSTADFNPPAHTGRDPADISRVSGLIIFQSTRPHGAGRGGGGAGSGVGFISIHPPTRGGTVASAPSVNTVKFQSTRPHGAGRRLTLFCQRQPYFNPPAHTGRDVTQDEKIVSVKLFQSTRPHGAGPCITVSPSSKSTIFQSTRPHGAGRPAL